MNRIHEPGRADRTGKNSLRAVALSVAIAATLLAVRPGFAVELSAPVAALYSTVSIYPPSARSMTVCYGFVCRRREILDFTPADRKALTQIMAAGPAAPGGEGAAAPEGVGGVRPPHGP